MDEAYGDNTFHLVSTLEPGVTPTRLADHSALIGTRAEQNSGRPRSSPGRDHKGISDMAITFSAGDYQLERGRYIARKPFTLTVYDDDFPEEDEYFQLALLGGEGYPHGAFPLCVGTTCKRLASDPDPRASVAIVSDDVGAPEDLTATGGSNQVDLSWDTPSILGTTDITGYRVEVAENANSTNWAVLAADTGSTTRTHAHTGLPPGATRHYRVAAIDDAGTGSLSRSASATTTGSPSGPVFTNAYLAVNRQSVSVRFSENLLETTASRPTPSAFTVKTDGTAVTVGSATVSGNQVLLVLGSVVDEGAATTLSYADPELGQRRERSPGPLGQRRPLIHRPARSRTHGRDRLPRKTHRPGGHLRRHRTGDVPHLERSVGNRRERRHGVQGRTIHRQKQLGDTRREPLHDHLRGHQRCPRKHLLLPGLGHQRRRTGTAIGGPEGR